MAVLVLCLFDMVVLFFIRFLLASLGWAWLALRSKQNLLIWDFFKDILVFSNLLFSKEIRVLLVFKYYAKYLVIMWKFLQIYILQWDLVGRDRGRPKITLVEVKKKKDLSIKEVTEYDFIQNNIRGVFYFLCCIILCAFFFLLFLHCTDSGN